MLIPLDYWTCLSPQYRQRNLKVSMLAERVRSSEVTAFGGMTSGYQQVDASGDPCLHVAGHVLDGEVTDTFLGKRLVCIQLVRRACVQA